MARNQRGSGGFVSTKPPQWVGNTKKRLYWNHWMFLTTGLTHHREPNRAHLYKEPRYFITDHYWIWPLNMLDRNTKCSSQQQAQPTTGSSKLLYEKLYKFLTAKVVSWKILYQIYETLYNLLYGNLNKSFSQQGSTHHREPRHSMIDCVIILRNTTKLLDRKPLIKFLTTAGQNQIAIVLHWNDQISTTVTLVEVPPRQGTPTQDNRRYYWYENSRIVSRSIFYQNQLQTCKKYIYNIG